MSNKEGGKIIELFNQGLDTGLLVSSVQRLYNEAENHWQSDNVTQAINTCQRGLKLLADLSKTIVVDPAAIPYSKGKFQLLLASIILDCQAQNKLAEEHFLQSATAFGMWRWFHLEGLAFFGVSISRYKSNKLESAIEACIRAQSLIQQEGIPLNIDVQPLITAVEDLRVKIEEELVNQESEDLIFAEQGLPVFLASDGVDIITNRAITKFNLLSIREYQRNVVDQPETIELDFTKCPKAKTATFILEVGQNLEISSSNLNLEDWLLIRSTNRLDRLNQRRVAVLSYTQDKSYISLKKLSVEKDHLFLEASTTNESCLVVVEYDSDSKKVRDYYHDFQRPLEIIAAHRIQITGEVIDHIPGAYKRDVAKGYLLRIPIFENISAGAAETPVKDLILRYRHVTEKEYNGQDFGIRVIGNSMNADDIKEGDLALIRKQPEVKSGEIAALVIVKSESETLGVLKRYFVEEPDFPKSNHWRLKSSNPLSADLIVIPPTSDANAIRAYYDRKERETPNKPFPDFYLEAEVVIVGKFVGVHRKS